MNAPIIPTMQYQDANKAVDWLCEAFGFEQKMVYRDDNGNVMHAELTYKNSVIMIGPRTDTPFGRMVKSPAELEGFNTQIIYMIVDDADAHYQKATAAGAKVAIDIQDQSYGGRDYTCRDFEGYLWSFGTYSPWGEE